MKTELEIKTFVIWWLKNRGYTVLYEHLVVSRSYVIGIKYYPRESRRIPKIYDVVVIELGIKNIKNTVRQCMSNQASGFKCYLSMPCECVRTMTPKMLDIFRNHNIGLLTVTYESVVLLLRPAPMREIHPLISKRLWQAYKKERKNDENNTWQGYIR
jgi:hypothetical protein